MNAFSPTELTALLDELLSAKAFDDYCPNGLQVDASKPIHKLVTGVTACQALIDAAVREQAEAILVHHGYFWKGEPAPLTGIKGKRIRTLIKHGISLIAYHLPLDAHPTLGNNALLACALELQIISGLDQGEHPIGNVASCAPVSLPELALRVERALDRKPLVIDAGLDQPITRVGLCSGAAQDMIGKAYALGCQVFISGEISERTTHEARELGIHYIAAGHHATETFGVRAVGEYLQDTHGLSVHFIDIDNPV